MKQMVIPYTIAALLGGLVALGLFSNLSKSAQPDTTVVVQAVPSPSTFTIGAPTHHRVITVSPSVAVDLVATWAATTPPDEPITTRATTTPTDEPVASEATAPSGLERAVAELINQQRQTHGLPALTLDSELTAAARRHSQDMATQVKPQHRGSDGSSARERILATGYLALRTSETIRWGDTDPAAVVASWLADDLHRQVLLSDQFSELGVGYVTQTNSLWQHYWTVDFGQRSAAGFQPVRYTVPTFDLPATATPTPSFDRPVESKLLDPISEGCPSGSEQEYATIPMAGVDSSHADWLHGDLNLAQRSYAPTAAAAHLIDLGGATDADAPQLTRLFADGRTPDFSATYQVYGWDWNCGQDGCRGEPLREPEVTLLGLVTRPGEPVYLPGRNAKIDDGGYVAAVLYADAIRLTLAYTRDGTVAHGYAIQLENLCVDPNLLRLYRQANSAGRDHLPALRPGAFLGVAATTEILVATRDQGTFLDPRSRKDWWRE